MASEKEQHSNLAVPPGEYLEEVIAELGMTKQELARRMGRPAAKLSLIFNGTKAVTPETAMQLEKVVGVPANIWLGLESEYRLVLARQEEEEQLAAEVKLVRSFCYSELAELGVVRKVSKPRDKVRELQRFFAVAALPSVLEVRRYQAALRVGKAGRATKPHASASWLRLGEVKAREMECEPFARPKLEGVLDRIRAMTLQTPGEFEANLSALLAECGVALVIAPHFPGTKAHGATFWLTRDKAVLMLTIRGRWADIFWFSLFHEIGHILLHGRRSVFIEDGSAALETSTREDEADVFAAEHLLPPSAYKRFAEDDNFYPEAITAFAWRVGIHPGIVVGRLQHDKLLRPEWGNQLRVRYTWAEDGATARAGRTSP